MKPDFYTKFVLTIIAIVLIVIAYNQNRNTTTSVSTEKTVTVTTSEAQFVGLQFVFSNGYSFFDPRTGEIWDYASNGRFLGKETLIKLGQNMK